MKTKLITATIALSSMFTAVSAQAASAVYNYAADGSITSLNHITGLMVDNVSYDLSFSDTWDGVYVDFDLAKKITDEFASALNPYSVSKTNTGENAGTLDSTTEHKVEFDMYSKLANGCDTDHYVSKCDMYLVTERQINSAFYAYYVSNDDKTPLTVSRGWDDDDSRNYRHAPFSNTRQRSIEDHLKHIVDDLAFDGANAKYRTFMSASLTPISPVPVPAAAFLFAPALLGLMGLRRKAKKLAA